MSVVTRLSVKDIQLAIRNSPWCDLRSDIIVPNVSWGLLPYEADLIQVKKSNLVVEYEIKRSFEDFKKDFTKYHTHDAQLIAYFYYVIPEKLIEKVRTFLINHFGSSENSPAVLYYDENSGIHTMMDENHKEFGNPKRKNYVKITESEKATLGRLVSIRYWNSQNEICKGGFSKKDMKIKDLNETVKMLHKKVKELQEREDSGKWIKPFNTLPSDDRYVILRFFDRIGIGYYDHKKNHWMDENGDEIQRYVLGWSEAPLMYKEYYI